VKVDQLFGHGGILTQVYVGTAVRGIGDLRAHLAEGARESKAHGKPNDVHPKPLVSKMAHRVKCRDQEKHDAKTEKCYALTSSAEQTSENGDEN
jgi:hypothetical protein